VFGLKLQQENTMLQPFETHSVLMQKFFLISVQAPPDDISRLLRSVVEIDPLAMGKYDSNAFASAGGTEIYRPCEGAVAGVEDEVRHRPGICEISFQIEPEQQKLEAIVEALFQVHNYQEPVITVREIIASRSKGLDDKNNPHRWWNTTGDWKTHS
jgi:hypothetical protein